MNRWDIITTKDWVEAIVDIVTDSWIYISGRWKKFNHPDRLFLTNKMLSDLLISKEAKVTSWELILNREQLMIFYTRRNWLSNSLIEWLDIIPSEDEFKKKLHNWELEQWYKLFYKNDPVYYRLVDLWLPEKKMYLLWESNESLDSENTRILFTPEQILWLFNYSQWIITKQQIADDFWVDVLNLKLVE